jgi:hypothetical protein
MHLTGNAGEVLSGNPGEAQTAAIGGESMNELTSTSGRRSAFGPA